jgi:Trypsin
VNHLHNSAIEISDGNASLVLMEGMVPIIAQSQCEQAYSSVGLPSTEIHESAFCAGYSEGGVDACQVDSFWPPTNR